MCLSPGMHRNREPSATVASVELLRGLARLRPLEAQSIVSHLLPFFYLASLHRDSALTTFVPLRGRRTHVHLIIVSVVVYSISSTYLKIKGHGEKERGIMQWEIKTN